MAFEKLAAGSCVEDDKSGLVQTRGDLIKTHWMHRRKLSKQGRADFVHALHVGEVGGRFGLSAENETHKLLFTFVERQFQGRVEFLLVAESGVCDRAERFSASAPGTVRGQDLHVAWHLRDLAEAFIKGPRALLLSALESSRLFQQVRAPGVSHKKEIAAEHGDRLIRPTAVVCDEKNHMLGRVARRVNGLQFDIADLEGVAVVEGMVAREGFRPLALPVRASFGGEVEFDGCVRGGEFPRSTYEIRVDMSFGNSCDFQPLLFGNFQIAVDVALRIYNNGFTGALAADEIGVLSQGRIGDLFEKHNSVLGFLFGAAGAALIPWHAGDEHSHAAPIGSSGKN